VYVTARERFREKAMRTGLWIDHKKAIVVLVTYEGEEIKTILSKAEKQLRRSGETPLKGRHEAQDVPESDSRQREFTGQLNVYYDEVIDCIRDAESILLLGPGEAKDELKKRLEKRNLGDRVAAVETADKMTDPQVAAKARQFFKPSP
jgi:hypothetical protein